MKTNVLKVNPISPQDDMMQTAARTIQAGRLVVFPTETVYGVGADAFNVEAVQRIFTAKERPASDPLIVHIADPTQLAAVAQAMPPLTRPLTERFWPGPLTLVLKRHPDIPPAVSAGLETVAVRMPSHPVALALIRRSGTAIVAPSANLFTRPSPTTAAHVLQDLRGRVDLILDAGPPDIGLESTVVDLTTTPPRVLRPGGTPVEALRDVVPDLQLQLQYLDGETEAASSPGLLSKHYSPQARVILFDGADNRAVLERMQAMAETLMAEGQTVGIMATEEDALFFSDILFRVAIIGTQQNLKTIGHNLFAKMRLLEAQQVDVILVRALERTGLGLAIWDRLLRAAEGQVVTVE